MEDMTDTSDQRLGGHTLPTQQRAARFHPVQLMPAPATVMALGLGAAHGLSAVPLAVVATAGALATIASALLPLSPHVEHDGGDRSTP